MASHAVGGEDRVKTAGSTIAAKPVERLGRLPGYECPECLQPFPVGRGRKIFCCPAHKRAWEARSRLRGLQLYPFAVVARVTRGGTRGAKIFTGTRAQRDADFLIQQWREEDAAAGRMSTTEYLDLRYRLGFDRP